MRDDVELALLIQIYVVVAGANPIAIIIDQRMLHRQKSQRLVDVENRRELLFQLIRRRLVQDSTELDQRFPRFLFILALDRVDALVRRRIIAQIRQASAAAGTALHLPARALACLVPFLQEVLVVDLLLVGVNPPVLAIDYHAREIRFGGRKEIPRDLVIQRDPQERWVFVTILKMQRVIAQQVLLVPFIDRDRERALFPFANHHER